MSDDRNALGVEAVMARFATAEQLLADATVRVHSLSTASSSATESSAALVTAAEGVTTASEQLVTMTAEMQAAHRSLVDAMGLARQFLEATDVSALVDSLRRLEERQSSVENGQVALAAQLGQHSDLLAERVTALYGAVDRNAELVRARDEANARLEGVMQQLPGRVAKKLQER